jgi:UDP-N-acetylglucosamine 2-epimerase (non-hydrolysing)
LALTRSAAARLAPVADALTGPQAIVDGLSAPEPLDLSAGEAARRAAAALESVRPDVALVAGDDDVALACTLAATRAGVPVARVGAGLRCGDRGDTREINRIAIDELACRLYTDDADASERLRAEGVDERRVEFVGSTLPDMIARWMAQAREHAVWERIGLRRGGYALVTLNRRDRDRLVEGITALARRLPVVVCGPLDAAACDAPVTVVAEPLDYVEHLSLLSAAAAVVTDSSGVQEETTVLGIPCFTLARTSERTLTLTHGTNVLLGDDGAAIADVTTDLAGEAEPIPLWDGRAGRRIAADLALRPWSDD